MSDMKLVIKIPQEFEVDFNTDRFEECLKRVLHDCKAWDCAGISGEHEHETLEMLLNAFDEAVVLPKGHKRLIEDNFDVGPVFDEEGHRTGYKYVTQENLNNAPAIIEADKEEV